MIAVRRVLAVFTAVMLGLGLSLARPAPAQASPPPALFPEPQAAEYPEGSVSIDDVELVFGSVSGSTKVLAETVVNESGGTVVGSGSTRLVVTIAGDDGSADDVPEQAEGYTLTVAASDQQPTITVTGRDDDGAYYGLQTLRQLVADGTAPASIIHDWPLMSTRGLVEGFYGEPWSHEARQDLMAFLPTHKLNTYLYAPKNDVYLREQWRQPYPENELARLADLVRGAEDHHIDLAAALSPGHDVCYTSQEDVDAAIAKLTALHEIGITRFSVALDDIDPERLCDEDKQAFPDGDAEQRVALAQAQFVEQIQQQYLFPQGLPTLMLVPTSYHGTDPDVAKSTFGEATDKAMSIMWTGGGIVDDSITTEEAALAATAFHRERLMLWDNFPVNDGDLDKLFLGQLPDRAPDLYTRIDGLLANPMVQAYASLPALASYGDYSWNGPGFDATASHHNALSEVAGDASEAAAALADALSTWEYDGDPEPTQLALDIEAYLNNPEAGREQLTERLHLLTQAPAALEADATPGFAQDVGPWANAAAQYASAGLHATQLEEALAQGSEYMATVHLAAMKHAVERAHIEVNGVVPLVGTGELTELTDHAEEAWEMHFGREIP